MNRIRIALVLFAAIVTLTMLFSPISYARSCRCGGCCVGCPGDCTTIGAPLPYAYWGVNGISKEEVRSVSWSGIVVDLTVWLALMLGSVRIARRLSV